MKASVVSVLTIIGVIMTLNSGVKAEAGCTRWDGFFAVGEELPTSDPCETCICNDSEKIVCSYQECNPDCPDELQEDVGQCCPVCKDGCVDDQGTGYEIGAEVPHEHPCVRCTCEEGGRIDCHSIECEPVSCPPELVVHNPDECCPTCKDGCYDDEGNRHEFGAEVPHPHPCVHCICTEDGEIQCHSTPCEPLSCHQELMVHDPDKCCPYCLDGCIDDEGNQYDLGDVVEQNDTCVTCICRPGDKIECHSEACPFLGCPEELFEYDNVDDCCPARCKKGCVDDAGNTYDIGEEVDGDPCHKCVCSRKGTIICSVMSCPPCLGTTVAIDGECCGKCVISITDGCEKDGVLYQYGEMVVDDPCKSCQCNSDGQIICAVIDCVPCAGTVIPPAPDQCCGECVDKVAHSDGCSKHGTMYEPGPVGDKCDGCFCRNGQITCSPPACPKVKLMCADPEIGPNCCPHCPNGPTCSFKKHIIRMGEFVEFPKNKICTCLGDPWRPNAFCANKRLHPLTKRRARRAGAKLADFSLGKLSDPVK